MKMRHFVLTIIVCFVATSGANAVFVTSFQTAMQPTTPASGWAYIWNSAGPVGVPANYSALLPTTDPLYYYDNDGVNGLPGAAPGAYIYLGRSVGSFFGGHPGLGLLENSGGVERYAIAAYTLSASGTISIENSLLSNADPSGSTDGLNLNVYVNNSLVPFVSTATAAGFGSTTSFDTSLGNLNAGDTIYVAVGARNFSFNDLFSLAYDITAVPEPGGILLAALAALFLIGSHLIFGRRPKPA